MTLIERLHFLHRAWRYRLRTERDELGWALRQPVDGLTAVDIGANRGIYSYWLHQRVGSRGRVVAFEPQPELQQAVRDVKETFSLDRLELRPCGLSSSEGTATLMRPKHHWGGASLETDSGAECDRLTIRLSTLDQEFPAGAAPRVGLIKCDVQGHEPAVFAGAEAMLRRDRPSLLIEIEEPQIREGSLLRLLAGLDYETYFFFEHRLAPMARFAELRPRIPKPYLNFVFLPRRQ